MEGIISAAFGSLNGLPSYLSVAVSITILFFAGFLYMKKTNIEEVTSVGTVQHQQIEGLMKQVELLSEELTKARNQLTAIHEQNMKLMVQVRESNIRIQELETIISKRGEANDRTEQRPA